MAIVLPFLAIIATLVAVAVGALYIFLKRSYQYWSKQNVPHLTPSIPFGNFQGFGTKYTLFDMYKNLYNELKNEKFGGIYTFHRPVLMVNDPDLIKRILIQDFMFFHDHGVYSNEKDDPLSAHLFSLEGAQWKNLRSKLSPTFTSGKMKNMFPLITDVSDQMLKVMNPKAEKGEIVEIKELIAQFSTDVIASCAFGIQTNSLTNPDEIFRKMGKKIFAPKWNILLKNLLSFIMPDVAKLLKLVVTESDVASFFMGTVKDTINYRKQNKVKRNDFMELMIQLMDKGFIEHDDDKQNKDDTFSINEAAAQAFIFFLGGFETSSSTLQFTFYELAWNQDIQDKLRKEILDELEKTDGKITYEGVHRMKYLGMVIDETLRKYPPAVILSRVCNEDYKIPDSDVTIEKGVGVVVPVAGIQNDERYFPEPEKFIPERFSDEEKENRNNYVYLPFGDGPRFCIGQRFAMMQMRVALVALLSQFHFAVCEKTPKVLKYDIKSIIILPEGGINLKVTKMK